MLKGGKVEFYLTGVYEAKPDGTAYVSKDGKPYMSLRYMLIGPSGDTHSIYSSFHGTKNECMEIAEAIGDKALIEQAKAGKLNVLDAIGRNGMCIAGIKKSNDPKYSDTNKIECFLKHSVYAVKPSRATEEMAESVDDLPF